MIARTRIQRTLRNPKPRAVYHNPKVILPSYCCNPTLAGEQTGSQQVNKLDQAPFCLIAKVRPAIVIVPLRPDIPGLGATE
jgi:hypothetical protein